MTATRLLRGPRGQARGRIATAALVVVGALVLLAGAAVVVRGAHFDLPNPFAETHRENPNSVVLAQLRDQSRYVAATARFQTSIDTEEDANYLPDAIKGSHETFIAE